LAFASIAPDGSTPVTGKPFAANGMLAMPVPHPTSKTVALRRKPKRAIVS
jgi:hypothetical protein